ncbi:hypothetical protein D3C73_1343380 [compost metagenome]
MLKGAWCSGEDHRRSHFITDFEDSLDRFGIVDVKRRYGIALCLGILQEVFRRNNAHDAILLAVPGMNNNALNDAVDCTAGRRRIRCIADTDGLRQCEHLGIHQEAESELHIDKSA